MISHVLKIRIVLSIQEKKVLQEVMVQWSPGPDHAFTVDSVKHVVTIKNELYLMMYNYVALGSNFTKIAVFNTDTKKWQSLPPFENLRGCAMVAMKDQIAVVGGHFEARKIPMIKTKDKGAQLTAHNVTMWEKSKPDWRQTSIKLPQGVFNCNGTMYKHWLVLMGYTKETVEALHPPVEVQMLNCETNQWFTRSMLSPVPMKNVASTVGGDTWHILSRSHKQNDKINSISLPALIVHVTTSVDASSVWTLVDVPHQFSSLLFMNDNLLLVGGAITPDGCYTPVSTILHYQPDKDKWDLIGHLPFPLSKSVCVLLPNGYLQIIGGLDWKDYRKYLNYSSSVAFLHWKKTN